MVGTVMGYALDRFFNTKPWLMVAGVILGGAAGCMNVYRIAQKITFNNDQDGQDE